MSAPIITLMSVVHPWMCDTMGHVNVRHYAAMFDDASFQFLAQLAGAEDLAQSRHGWADVRCEIEYRHETLPGTPVTIRSGVLRIGRTSLTYRQQMTGTLDGIERAVATVSTVRFDLVERRSAPLEDAVRSRAEALMLPPQD